MIDRFIGQYEFLSNFFLSRFVLNGIMYKTVEHYFQARKAVDKISFYTVVNAFHPGMAKKLGRQVEMSPTWEEEKEQVMKIGLKMKFSNPILRRQLIETAPKQLVEGNTWNDTYWGVSLKTGKGLNRLGILLMEVRDDVVRMDDDAEALVSYWNQAVGEDLALHGRLHG